MNISEYLALPEVTSFVNWLRRLVSCSDAIEFHHSYLIEAKGSSNVKLPWHCHSIFNAFESYEWKFSFTNFFTEQKVVGQTYNQSAHSLESMRVLLRDAVLNGDNESCYQVCCMILKWGGVLGSDVKGNQKSLLVLKPNLAAYLAAVEEYFNHFPELTSSYKVQVNGRTEKIRMNAGYTKIYALLCNDFIIYDGRVGGALGLLVRLHLESLNGKKYEKVPDSLAFYYGKAKNPKVNRNPSKQHFVFKALSGQASVHIRNNIKANWILSALNLTEQTDFSKQQDPLRAFEAALFMIGYKL